MLQFLLEEHGGELVEGSAPCEPLMTGARRLKVDMVDSQILKSYMQVVDALVHAGGLVGTY